ncbi:MAG: ATP-binding cassette domain-containing protein [Verrucomicrobia bacterium]|nr:ATP-binding cassette domain-containing protein [Verrucomicrobiota bacterium]MCH8526527.1 ATP-binding cassette domain-containing protein [Kiritimatiellia bacterium]
MIRFNNVIKVFGEKPVLRGFNLHVHPGETISLVGTSGAGKSVTLKHMVRLLKATEGEVVIDGININELDGRELEEVRKRFGYLFQSAALLQWLTVFENVALPLRENGKFPESEIHERVESVLAKVGLEEAAEKLPADISGGMQKRAGLARAVVTEPDILLYDEPTSGLDPVTSRTIDELIFTLQKDLGVTSVVVTHDMISALTISDRIAMLHQGTVLEVTPPREFLHSKNEIVRGFLDSQCINPDFFDDFPERILK